MSRTSSFRPRIAFNIKRRRKNRKDAVDDEYHNVSAAMSTSDWSNLYKKLGKRSRNEMYSLLDKQKRIVSKRTTTANVDRHEAVYAGISDKLSSSEWQQVYDELDADSKDKLFAILDKRRIAVNETDYGQDGVEDYAKLQKELNYFYDGFKSTIIHQLSLCLKDKNPAKMRLLDVACGDGNYSRTLAEQFGFSKIYAFDISEHQIKKARALSSSAAFDDVTFRCVDASTFHKDESFESLKGSFDVAVIPWFFSYATDKTQLAQYVESIAYMLKPNALIIGATVSISDVDKLRTGVLLNDRKFCIEFPSAENVREDGGKWVHLVGSKKFRFVEYVYTHQTYSKLFNTFGCGNVRFLGGKEYVDGKHCDKKENQLLQRLVSAKENPLHIFVSDMN